MASGDPVPAEGLRFECTQCGKCCTARGEYTYVYLNPQEVRDLAQLFGIKPRVFREQYTVVDEDGWTQLVFNGKHCTFLDPATNRCKVYEARPAQCRTFPFWEDMVEDGKWSAEAKQLCEGVGQGRLYPAHEISARMLEMETSDED